jgi:hypothetical protein
MASLVTQATSGNLPGKSSAPAAVDNIRAIGDKKEQDVAPKRPGYVRVYLHFPVRSALPPPVSPTTSCFPEAHVRFVLSKAISFLF